MTKNSQYSRFWRAWATVPNADEESRREMIRQYSRGRTDSLRALEPHEYVSLCEALEGNSTLRALLRKARSSALLQMQKLGIDTSNWSRVDAFCQESRIAGKKFRELTADELDRLTVKLRAIRKKSKDKPTKRDCDPVVVMLNIDPDKLPKV